MMFVSRYDLGDVVWRVRKFNARMKAPCDLCSATGRVAIAADESKTATCPDCRGSQFSPTATVYDETRATVSRLTLGQIRAKVTVADVEFDYMAHETGIGSGTVHQESDLYPSPDEAMVACADATLVFDERGTVIRDQTEATP